MRSWHLSALCLVSIGAALQPASAELLSKKYKFRAETTLEIGEDVAQGVRVDSVRFSVPAGVAGRIFRVGGLVQAVVAVSNVSQESHKVGVAVAVFDEEGRLLGVASGGSTVRGIRPYRQVGYALVFDHVNADMGRAATFQISVEAKP